MQFTSEQIEKAKAAKSVEQLLALAKENGIEMTEEEAAKYYAEWHKEGALADEELSNVNGGSFCYGGSTYSSDLPHYLIVTSGHSCSLYQERAWPYDMAVKGTCWYCTHSELKDDSVITYCKIRKFDDDPLNP